MGTFFARLQRSCQDLVIGGRLDSNGDIVSLCMVGLVLWGLLASAMMYKSREELVFRESQGVYHHRMWRGGGGWGIFVHNVRNL